MLSRRTLLLALAGAPLAACNTIQTRGPQVGGDDLTDWYIGSLPDQPHAVPLVDRSKMRPELARQTVR
jgi:predicted small secreted protein